MNMCHVNVSHPQNRQQGLTLIELMVTLSIAGILAAIAAPSLQSFVSRNAMRSLANDFTLSIQRTRTEAINRNECIVVCKSSNAGEARPVCDTANANWAVGWAVYRLPSCNVDDRPQSATAATTNAANLITTRPSSAARYNLAVQGTAVRAIMFNARGVPGLSGASKFNLSDTNSSNAENNTYGRSLCIDKVGRVRSIAYGYDCS